MVMLPQRWSALKTGLIQQADLGMELDNAISPNLGLLLEKELEEEGAEGLGAAQHHPRPAVPASPGGRAQGLTGEASVIL